MKKTQQKLTDSIRNRARPNTHRKTSDRNQHNNMETTDPSNSSHEDIDPTLMEVPPNESAKVSINLNLTTSLTDYNLKQAFVSLAELRDTIQLVSPVKDYMLGLIGCGLIHGSIQKLAHGTFVKFVLEDVVFIRTDVPEARELLKFSFKYAKRHEFRGVSSLLTFSYDSHPSLVPGRPLEDAIGEAIGRQSIILPEFNLLAGFFHIRVRSRGFGWYFESVNEYNKEDFKL